MVAGEATNWGEAEMTELAADLGMLSQREFRVGAALSRTFKIFSRNAVPFSIIGLISALPIEVFSYYQLSLTPNERMLWLKGPGMYWMIGGILLYSLLGSVITAVILHASFQDMRGRPVKLGESIQRGLGRLFPLVGASILMMLGVMLGAILLVIPAFILLTRWFVAAPVCIVERQGPLGSLKRSAQLTKGHRWKLFGAFLIAILLSAVIGQLIGVLGLVISPFAVLAVSGVWQAIWTAFYSVLTVVLYHDLRVQKEGVDIESIASVFD